MNLPREVRYISILTGKLAYLIRLIPGQNQGTFQLMFTLDEKVSRNVL